MTTKPTTLVLGSEPTAELYISGLTGSGALRAAVNAGQVEAVQPTEHGALVRYRMPEGRYPRVLGLLLWRPGRPGPGWLLRVPLHGQTRVPVRTRARSEVRLTVGHRRYGPLKSGRRGRVRVDVVVAPGIREASVEVMDRKGLVTHKTIPIETVDYNPLVLALRREPGPAIRVVVGSADPDRDVPRASIDGRPLPLARLAPGLWGARVPARQGSVTRVRAWLAVNPAWAVEGEVETPAAVTRQPARPPAPPAAREERRLRAVAGVAVGLLHNTGALLSPRFSAELGLDLRFSWGWLGLRALVGTSWASQTIEAPDGLADGASRVLLLPVGGGLCYSLPLRLLTPYALAAAQAQLVRTRSSGPFLPDDEVSNEWGLALLGLIGAERALGPGLIFLQSGFQWATVDSAAVELLAGGVIVEAGYRLRL